MGTARSEKLADARGLRFAIELDSRPATFADVLRGWQSDAGFRSLFNPLLAEATFTAFRWETPAVTRATLSQPFEFVLLDSPGRVGVRPVWLSTAGAGVSWLHVRLDDRPKYYGFGPYK